MKVRPGSLEVKSRQRSVGDKPKRAPVKVGRCLLNLVETFEAALFTFRLAGGVKDWKRDYLQ